MRGLLAALITASVVIGVYFAVRPFVASGPEPATLSRSAPASDRPPTYAATVAQVRQRRHELAERYRAAVTVAEKRALLAAASDELARSIYEDLMPFWYGTKWAFHGTTETPGTGAIACGYFVSTVLRDAGLRVERVRLAQQASEHIIKSLTAERHIRRFSNVPLHRFVAAVRRQGRGVYVVGLDYHAGFIVNDGQGGVFFIHSVGVPPHCVVKEDAHKSQVLHDSRYRVIGQVTADTQLLVSWLEDRPIPTTAR